ncbi:MULTISPECIES: PP2C family protein-serine/threonine phosphatase [unclassified Leucobacter]|uniref:PP2C family protein-serine/threonine phosphatase n=1 Tax=unclassified Leucobacter TaxID=2621730 RepID=UPI000621537F|nr:protein phosphatase 2C domain-containing protein [Leucobacter sp. Ag1]KKI21620.1 protein phosphatase [Leucobacter sp. Ag1]
MTERGENAVRRRIGYRPGSDLEIELSWHAITDVGRRREVNQDSYVVIPPVFAVADGMGGHSAGEVASAAVVRRLAELGGNRTVSERDIDGALEDAVEDIELDAGETDLGAGTTVTGVTLGSCAEEPTWTVFNIGDSRVYQYFKGALSQITVDHSVVQHLIDTGAITPEEAEFHPHANVITRAVGFNEAPSPDYTALALIPGQRILICSDGLTKELTEIGIQHFLATTDTAEEAAKQLVHHAIENAGRDNVTVVVIDVHAVGEARDTSDLAIAGVSLDAVGGENPAEIRAGAEAAATEAPVETEPVEVVGIDSDSDSEDAIPAEGVAASGSDDEGPDTVPVRVPLG